MRQSTSAIFAISAILALTPATPAAAAAREHVVTMTNMSFGRMPADVRVGDTIVWVNDDSVIHSATARDKSFDVRLQVGQSARTVMQKPGAIPFYCLFHAQMRGALKVAP